MTIWEWSDVLLEPLHSFELRIVVNLGWLPDKYYSAQSIMLFNALSVDRKDGFMPFAGVLVRNEQFELVLPDPLSAPKPVTQLSQAWYIYIEAFTLNRSD